MRPVVLPSLLAAAGLMTGCDALDEFEETFVDELVIPGTIGPGSPFSAGFGGSLDDLDLSTTQGFRDAGVSPADVDSIRLVAGSLSIDLGDPRLNDLSIYVASIELFVESDNRPRTSITRLDELPMAESVELPLESSPELKPFATDSGMSFGAEVVLRTQPALNVRLVTSLTLRVDINLLGA